MSALHVYTLYRTYGDDIFEQNIETLYGMDTDFASPFKVNPNFELSYESQCNIVCFRFTEGKDDFNSLNEEIRNFLLKEGRFILLSLRKTDNYTSVFPL